MRIATWNVERFKHRNKIGMILKACDDTKADILVLTETDEHIVPNYPFYYRTTSLKGVEAPILYKGKMVPVRYANSENRVSIFTRYRCVKEHMTFNHYTALCIELATEFGNLLVYGTIMGVHGNREASFMSDLERQMEDINRLTKENQNICVIGDYNLSFIDNYYHTTLGRQTVQNCFGRSGILILTAEKSQCIDHVAVSDGFMSGHRVAEINEWNCDKELSDHKGIVVQID